MIVHDKFDFMLQVDAVVKKINTAVFADKYKTPFAEYNAFLSIVRSFLCDHLVCNSRSPPRGNFVNGHLNLFS